MLKTVPMTKALRKFLSLALLAFFLVVGWGEQAHAVVLCFGEQHAAFEAEYGDRCAQGGAELCLGAAGAVSGGEEQVLCSGTDPCLDFCLFTAGALPQHGQVPLLPTVCLRHLDLAPALRSGISSFQPSLDTPPPYRAAMALKTIVLLI